MHVVQLRCHMWLGFMAIGFVLRRWLRETSVALRSESP